MVSPKIKVFGSFSQFFASGFGSGCAPKAPGTFGTLAAIPIWWLLIYFFQPNRVQYSIFIIVTFIFGVFVCDKASKELKVHDHSGIVWDEFVGFFITMFAIKISWLSIVLGFILFRFFDILKPFPIKYLDDKVKGGFGIMIDDVLAGIFAWCCLQLLFHFNLI